MLVAPLARIWIEPTGSVPNTYVFFGRFIAFALLSYNMKYSRSLMRFELSEYLYEFYDVVSVVCTKVSYR